MEELISSFQAASYPPFPSLSSLVHTFANSAPESIQDLHILSQKSDLSTQIKFFLGLLWDLSEFLVTNETYNVTSLQGKQINNK